MDTSGPVTDELLAAARAHAVVVLDTSGVTFADSSFLNLFLRAHALTDFRVAAAPEQLQRLLEMTCADTVLRLHPTVEAATIATPLGTRDAG